MEKLTIDKVIQLSVPQGTRGEHKCYSLDELKDLQSKLMLIAAKASQGKEEVDRFMDVSFLSSFKQPFILVMCIAFNFVLFWRYEVEKKQRL